MDDKQINFRKATIDDVNQIWLVERASFPTPWTKEAFIKELTDNRLAHYFVLELGNQIIGYAGMWIILDEAHITNVAIHPETRGRKLGELLMRNLMTMAKLFGAKKMTLEVRESNRIALNLYCKLDFKRQGIRKKYYTNPIEDAIIMWVKL
ncbi:ribosomal protein S18-alanine N-acetyltransferase [Vulcanibacillus modesticaldus]|uniref:ribosomal protein S18-alanine N-acetyltransferase n=1 Tax=Vulcanibacillus modesticaldus TaxID=337097 RepID=UPI000A00C38A|nr:ribosomal protein S18-alanine N-acetyltransferase [Vulcanibacillus modesticaldus]